MCSIVHDRTLGRNRGHGGKGIGRGTKQSSEIKVQETELFELIDEPISDV